MIFSSVMFLFRFLPIFLLCYFSTYLLRSAAWLRNVILILGSLFFYAWGEPVAVLLLIVVTSSDYLHGRLIDRFRNGIGGRLFLWTSVAVNVAILVVFKYGAFLQLKGGFAGESLISQFFLPLGVSFYTLRSMSYCIDVYRNKAKVQKNLLCYAVYVTMFPQLIAGPVVRYKDLQDQLKDRPLDPEGIRNGCRRFCVGLAKKVLLADRLALLWEQVLEQQASMNMLMAWLGVVAFGLQIYFDFSGYSDMAIGLGGILGFRLPENFRYPYTACSVSEFWRRWHISLGRWFREYIYIPLGGNRKGHTRQMCNLLMVWVLSGIWHGISLHFLLWGLWCTLFLWMEKGLGGRLLKHLPGWLGWIYTMIAVMIGWIFFALGDFREIGQYLLALVGFGPGGWFDLAALFTMKEYSVVLIVAVLAAGPMGNQLAVRMRKGGSGLAIAANRLFEKCWMVCFLLLSILYLVSDSCRPFLYFRF